jgi:hypothetical protein
MIQEVINCAVHFLTFPAVPRKRNSLRVKGLTPMIKSRLLLFSLALLGLTATAAVKETALADTAPLSATTTDLPLSATKIITIDDANASQLMQILSLTDDLNNEHKSKRSVLIFFGHPGDLITCSTSLEKLAAQRSDELTVVTIDPQTFSQSDYLQKSWIQGAPRYPAAVFIGNGVLLPMRGAIKGENIEELAQKGLNWDWHKNHPGEDN